MSLAGKQLNDYNVTHILTDAFMSITVLAKPHLLVIYIDIQRHSPNSRIDD